MANSRHCSYSASDTLTNCHSACAENSQNTASTNMGKYRENKLGWVMALCSDKLTIFHVQRLQTPHAAMFPDTLIDLLKSVWGCGYLGKKKTTKQTKKQDNSNILSDNRNETLFHTILLVWGVFLPWGISGNGCSLMGFSSVCFRFAHIPHRHPKVQLLRRSYLFYFHCAVRACLPCRFCWAGGELKPWIW